MAIYVIRDANFGRLLTSVQDLTDANRSLLNQVQYLTRKVDTAMATDRDLMARMAAALPALANGVRTLTDDNASLRARVAELEGSAASDEAEDTAAVAPVADALDALVAEVQAAAPGIQPVETPEEALPVATGETSPSGELGENPDQPVSESTEPTS